MFRFVFIFVPLLFGLMLAGFFTWAQRPDSPPSPDQTFRPIAPAPVQRAPATLRIREGTTFKNLLVSFRPAGDRTVLYTADSNQRYMCHENLELERILTAIQEKPERKYWRIEGEFAEFRGENFITIRRSMIAPAPNALAP